MWDIDFISEDNFRKHVKETIEKYGEKLKPVDLKQFNKNIVDPVKMLFDKNVYGFTRPVVTGLNARSMFNLRYGDLNSPFEYDFVKALYYNYRKIQVVK